MMLMGRKRKKNCKKQIKKSLELKKLSREKVINNVLNRKDTIIRLIAVIAGYTKNK